MFKLISLILFFFTALVNAQTPPDPSTLLKNAVAYHDPDGAFLQSKVKLVLAETGPNNRNRETTIVFDFPNSVFHASSKNDGRVIEYIVQNDSAVVKIDGSTDISEEDKKKFRIRPNRAQFMRNYYAYLYGLPMKLDDPGTIIDPEIKKTQYDGKDVFALKVTYEAEVGGDTWYFYFDVSSSAMVGYRFYHDESKNDGEYITLAGEATAGKFRLPKTRKWYMHQDDKFLGTDEIVKFEIIR